VGNGARIPSTCRVHRDGGRLWQLDIRCSLSVLPQLRDVCLYCERRDDTVQMTIHDSKFECVMATKILAVIDVGFAGAQDIFRCIDMSELGVRRIVDRILRSHATESIQYINTKLISEELPLPRGLPSSLYTDSSDRYLFDAQSIPYRHPALQGHPGPFWAFYQA
jgi:hypothetical protein